MPGFSHFDRVCVVLVRTRNPLNIGAAARAMCNFGFERLRVVRPYEPAFRQARSAVGAGDLLRNAEEFSTVAEAVADCTLVVGTTAVKERQLQHPLKDIADAAPFILSEVRDSADERRCVAILFGSEKTGLSNQDLSYCDWLMQVPATGPQPSMNLGQAVAVCLYELVRGQADPLPAAPRIRPSSAELERVGALLLDALRESGYLHARESAEKELAIRRMLLRQTLSSEDAALWLGMLRQILWKLRAIDTR